MHSANSTSPQAELQQFHELYIGSSFPTLITTSTGEKAILKMKGCGNGMISLLNEFIANRVAHLLGWPVPNARFINIRDDHPWQFGTDEFDDILTRSAGTNLAIDLIEGATLLAADEYAMLSEDLLSQIFTLDLFFMNIDRAQNSRNLLRDTARKIWIVDHGSLLLFSSDRAALCDQLFENHFLSGQTMLYLQRQILNRGLFSEILEGIPPDVFVEGGISENRVHEIITGRIEFLERH